MRGLGVAKLSSRPRAIRDCLTADRHRLGSKARRNCKRLRGPHIAKTSAHAAFSNGSRKSPGFTKGEPLLRRRIWPMRSAAPDLQPAEAAASGSVSRAATLRPSGPTSLRAWFRAKEVRRSESRSGTSLSTARAAGTVAGVRHRTAVRARLAMPAAPVSPPRSAPQTGGGHHDQQPERRPAAQRESESHKEHDQPAVGGVAHPVVGVPVASPTSRCRTATRPRRRSGPYPDDGHRTVGPDDRILPRGSLRAIHQRWRPVTASRPLQLAPASKNRRTRRRPMCESQGPLLRRSRRPEQRPGTGGRSGDIAEACSREAARWSIEALEELAERRFRGESPTLRRRATDPMRDRPDARLIRCPGRSLRNQRRTLLRIDGEDGRHVHALTEGAPDDH
jgi:hypothetical protein